LCAADRPLRPAARVGRRAQRGVEQPQRRGAGVELGRDADREGLEIAAAPDDATIGLSSEAQPSLLAAASSTAVTSE
jgi:hypothetical protein